MTHARARFALLAITAVGVLGLAVPASADAFVSYYNCVNKAHNSWCDGRANGSYDGQHSWDYNQASNPGGGSFIVCQRVWKPSTGGVLLGSTCNLNYSPNYYGNVTCACYDAEVKQQSGGAASVNGFADAG